MSKGAAYLRLQVPDDGISQGLQYWGGIKARENAEEKLADERAAVRKAQSVKDWEEKFGLKEGDFVNKYTGFQKYDDVLTDFAMYSTDRYLDLQDQARQSLESGDNIARNQIEGQMIKQKSDFKEVAKAQESLGTLFESYQKATQEGKVSGASKHFEDIMQSIFMDKNVAIRYDDNNNLVLTGLTPADAQKYGLSVKGGNGEPFVVPFQDVMDGSFSWYEKQQISGKDGLVSNIVNDLGQITVEGVDGMFKTSTQEWKDDIHGKAADNHIDSLLGNDEVMGDLLYQLSGGEKAKMFDFSEGDYKLVKDKMKEMVRAGYSEEFGKEFDTGRATNAREWHKISKKDEEKGDLIEAEAMTDSEGNLLEGLMQYSASDLPAVQAGGKYTLRTANGKPITGVFEDDDKAQMLSIIESDGEFFAQKRTTRNKSVLNEDTGSTDKVPVTTTKIVKLTDEELNRVGRRTKTKNAGELIDYLRSRRGEAPKQGMSDQEYEQFLKDNNLN